MGNGLRFAINASAGGHGARDKPADRIASITERAKSGVPSREVTNEDGHLPLLGSAPRVQREKSSGLSSRGQKEGEAIWGEPAARTQALLGDIRFIGKETVYSLVAGATKAGGGGLRYGRGGRKTDRQRESWQWQPSSIRP